ncbi:cation diffusion facilitator family transporter [Agrococcus sp. 1P02AA]|uniref:cation diffusion facilitator family transporter n=1 Tax=Agrococcus sp. 1P02AA TaxID=3132259 RepID=UPI0039A52CE4
MSGENHDHDHDHAPGHTFGGAHPARPVAADGGGHGHSHGLDGHATATGKHRKKLIIVICITGSIFFVQLAGAFISNSLALLADAGHMLTDALGVTIALIASLLATLPATSKRTFGLMRIEVLAAMANGIILGVIAVVIVVEGVRRLGTEVEVAAGPMLIAAIIGAVANLISLLVLQSGQKESLNVRGAYLEVLGDLLGSVAVIIAGVIILITEWYIVDQLASFAIALLIAPRAYSLLRDVLRVLLEATPKDVDLDQTRDHLLSVPGVVGVHDLHAWTITSGVNALSAHVVVDEGAERRDFHEILDELHACLGEHFDTDHCTLQLEPEKHAHHEHALHS